MQRRDDFMLGVAARLPQLTERDYSLMLESPGCALAILALMSRHF